MGNPVAACRVDGCHCNVAHLMCQVCSRNTNSRSLQCAIDNPLHPRAQVWTSLHNGLHANALNRGNPMDNFIVIRKDFHKPLGRCRHRTVINVFGTGKLTANPFKMQPLPPTSTDDERQLGIRNKNECFKFVPHNKWNEISWPTQVVMDAVLNVHGRGTRHRTRVNIPIGEGVRQTVQIKIVVVRV